MKRNVFLLLIVVMGTTAKSQCYEPNIRKADAAYEAGNVVEAYNAYRNATKCPDAARFENGKVAKEGMRKCRPSLAIDGNREDFVIHVGADAGTKRLNVDSRNLPRWGTAGSGFVKVKEKGERHMEIAWDANHSKQERRQTVRVYGLEHPVEVERVITIVQAGKTRNLLVNGNENHTIAAPSNPYSTTLSITATGAWEYKVDGSAWISAKKQGNDLVVELAQNKNMPKRSGSITITSAGEKSNVAITQAADPKFREEDYAGQAYMEIKDIEFGNSFDGDNSVGNLLYTDNITWLSIYIRYDGKTASTRKVDSVYCKIYKPDGKLSSGSSSPQGYSFRNSISVKNGSDQRSYFWGWGNETGNFYNESGEYRCEIWYRGKMLFSKKLVLKKAGPVFTKIDFVATDAEGKEIGEYGNTFNAEDIEYLKPRIHYTYDGPRLKGKSFNVKLISPTGSVIGRGYRKILKQGKAVSVDSTLYRDYVAEIVPGRGMTFTLAPFSCAFFKDNPGVYTLQLLAGTKNIQATTQLLIKNSSYNYVEYILPPSAGWEGFLLDPPQRTGKYSIDVVENNSITQHYEYTQGNGRITTSLPTRASIAVGFMTDSSFVVRYLSKARHDCYLTIKSDKYTDVAKFTTSEEEIKKFRSRQRKLPIETVKGLNVDLVFVDGGAVVLGKTAEISGEPEYSYKPYLYETKGFYIMRYPVTQKLWKEIMGAEPLRGWTKKEGKGNDWTAYNISLEEAKLFVAKLNARTGMTFSLPNSSEWEYAMRGGINADEWGTDDYYCYSSNKYHEWVYNGWNDTYITHKRNYPSTLYSKDCRDCITTLRLIVRMEE